MRHRSIAQPLVPLSTRQLVSFLSTSIRTKYDKVHTSTSRYIPFRPSIFPPLRTFVMSSKRGPCEAVSGVWRRLCHFFVRYRDRFRLL